ncbi:MAG: putative lipid II flippase FtsW [Alphaproteobacteria bacterium]
MSGLARTDISLIGRWWWTVDRWLLFSLLALIFIGALMVLGASPPVAERLDLDSYYFVRRHLILLLPTIATMIAVSLLSPVGVRRVAVILLAFAFLLAVATIFVGLEVKGARRWIAFAGLSIQPTEFIKPALAVVVAWMLTAQRQYQGIPGDAIAMSLVAAVILVLVMQPDFGMALTVAAVWFAQYYLAGLSLVWVGALIGCGVGGTVLGYLTFDHVRSRIDRFLDPAAGDNYQVETSLRAFSNGGLFGRGPGEGVVKTQLPDAHADFVFAVLGEEFGLIACFLVVGIFAFVVLRGLVRLTQEDDLFSLLAAAGLLTQFGLQALINIAVTLRLVPTKGMTLPFVSYGGSSMIALAIGMGMVLALTRWRPGPGSWR